MSEILSVLSNSVRKNISELSKFPETIESAEALVNFTHISFTDAKKGLVSLGLWPNEDYLTLSTMVVGNALNCVIADVNANPYVKEDRQKAIQCCEVLYSGITLINRLKSFEMFEKFRQERFLPTMSSLEQMRFLLLPPIEIIEESLAIMKEIETYKGTIKPNSTIKKTIKRDVRNGDWILVNEAELIRKGKVVKKERGEANKWGYYEIVVIEDAKTRAWVEIKKFHSAFDTYEFSSSNRHSNKYLASNYFQREIMGYDHLENEKRVLGVVKQQLDKIKGKGYTLDENYLKLSTVVVSVLSSHVIDKVNANVKDFDDGNVPLIRERFPSAKENAVDIVRAANNFFQELKKLDMDSAFKSQFDRDCYYLQNLANITGLNNKANYIIFSFYNLFHESDMNLAEVIEYYKVYYLKEYDHYKVQTIIDKVKNSSKIAAIDSFSIQQRVMPSYVDFGAAINSVMWFTFQSNKTQALAVLIAAQMWHERVNSYYHFGSYENLKENTIGILKKYNLCGEMPKEVYEWLTH